MSNNSFTNSDPAKNDDQFKHHRQPCVAGQFYPGNEKSLRTTLTSLFAVARPTLPGKLRALVSPHAGYIFSGSVAASAFNQIPSDATFDHIFLIGSSHRTHFNGASVYDCGNYLTPLGSVEVDTKVAKKLIEANEVFTYRPEAHLKEHSLEVQLPFLQFHLKKPFRIVPVIIATQSVDTIRKISALLQPYFTPDNLFVISSDFSHYPSYDDAIRTDMKTAQAIATNSSEKFLRTINSPELKKIPNLATPMCGWSSMLALLFNTEKSTDLNITLLDYKNSGDSSYGDKESVVGYWAIAFYQEQDNPESGFLLSEQEKQTLLKLAKNAIIEKLTGTKTNFEETIDLTGSISKKTGVFVSVYVNGELRGCIGHFGDKKPLYSSVQQLAVSAATEDLRFKPVTKKELPDLDLEISVLTPLKKISSISEIVPGKHGIYLKKGLNSGTFLPQVMLNNNWNIEEFLGHCARDKAHIGWDGWRNADIFTYEAIIFGRENTNQK